MKKIEQIAAEYSRFSRELMALDKAWTLDITDMLNQTNDEFALGKASELYADYLTKFEEQKDVFYRMMDDLKNYITEIKKEKGTIPYSVTRLRTNLNRFNREHKIESHLAERIKSIKNLVDISREDAIDG